MPWTKYPGLHDKVRCSTALTCQGSLIHFPTNMNSIYNLKKVRCMVAGEDCIGVEKSKKKKNNRIMNFWLLKRNKLQGPSFGDFHIDLSRIVENGAPRVCYHNKFARRVGPK